MWHICDFRVKYDVFCGKIEGLCSGENAKNQRELGVRGVKSVGFLELTKPFFMVKLKIYAAVKILKITYRVARPMIFRMTTIWSSNSDHVRTHAVFKKLFLDFCGKIKNLYQL